MTKETAFWDASALVPLCLYEPITRQARSFLRKLAPVTWWGSKVEVHSAITRLDRTGKLTAVEKKGALARLSVLSSGWKEILPSDHLRELATLLLDKHDLRAADSLQLAAAMMWCQQRPSKRSFVCGDQRLSKAAQNLGFTVLQLSAFVP